MTNEELQALTEKLSLERFGRPFTHQVFFNSRLRTTGGRYHLRDHHIDINPKMVAAGSQVLTGVILHELCHYHLHLTGRDYHHRSRDFKVLLKRVGGSRFAPAVGKVNGWEYRCQGCGVKIFRQRRFNVRRYRCARCGGRFRLLERVSVTPSQNDGEKSNDD